MLVLFVEPERCIADMGPAGIVSPVRLGVPGIKVASSCPLEGAGAVVRTEQDQRVVEDALLLEKLHEPADVLVEHIDHRRKHLHAIGFPLALLVAQAGPGGDMVRARTEFPLRR